MSNRNAVLLSAVALALAIVGIVVGLFARPALAQQAAVGTPRQVTVVGNGEVFGTPDTATVQVGVETQAATSQEALAQNNAQVQALIAKLKELGIDEKDIQTANFSVSPTYNDTGREITGYRVANSVSVTIRELAKAGALLDEVVKLGANSIYGISFSVADTAALTSQARDKALVEAKAKAEQLARASGATLGQVLAINENVGAQPPVMYRQAEMSDAAGNVPMQAGQQSISLQIQVTYELK
jgi:uncharacterized protein YggE